MLKSNCLITNQPDWGSVEISYTGKQLDQEKLLRYLISFRDHNEFHEQCVERIFCDLMQFGEIKKFSEGLISTHLEVTINKLTSVTFIYCDSNLHKSNNYDKK